MDVGREEKMSQNLTLRLLSLDWGFGLSGGAPRGLLLGHVSSFSLLSSRTICTSETKGTWDFN